MKIQHDVSSIIQPCGPMFKHCGFPVKIWSRAHLAGLEHITLGHHIIIDDFVLIIASMETNIGSYVHIASFSSITGGGKFTMEDFSSFSSGVRAITGTEDFAGGTCLTNPTVPEPFRVAHRGEIILRKHSMIGTNAVILPDVEIGEGTVVGAGAVVNRSLDPWMVYAGVPAKPIRPRPKDKILWLEEEFYNTYGR